MKEGLLGGTSLQVIKGTLSKDLGGCLEEGVSDLLLSRLERSREGLGERSYEGDELVWDVINSIVPWDSEDVLKKAPGLALSPNPGPHQRMGASVRLRVPPTVPPSILQLCHLSGPHVPDL
jgi:hypothetical protein